MKGTSNAGSEARGTVNETFHPLPNGMGLVETADVGNGRPRWRFLEGGDGCRMRDFHDKAEAQACLNDIAAGLHFDIIWERDYSYAHDIEAEAPGEAAGRTGPTPARSIPRSRRFNRSARAATRH